MKFKEYADDKHQQQAATKLKVFLGKIYCELPKQDEIDKEYVKDILKEFKEITEKNILLGTLGMRQLKMSCLL